MNSTTTAAESVEAILGRAATLTGMEVAHLALAWDTGISAAGYKTREAAVAASLDADWGWDAAWLVANAALGNIEGSAAWDAIVSVVAALLGRDKIQEGTAWDQAAYASLVRPWISVMGPV